MSFPAEEGWVPQADGTFVASLGRVFQRKTADGCEIGLVAEDRLRNLSGVLHGGVMMTLLDRAGGVAVRDVAAGERVATASITVNFLRPVPVDAPVTIHCRLRKSGRKSFFTDADAFAGGTLVATATAVYMRVGE
jgi:uncharacterized protein (TIGR00369 family)